MRIASRIALCAVAAASVLGSATSARVHPHVFAEARLDVTVNPDDTVASLKHLWRFDDLFSSTVLVEFDKNQDLKLDEAELAEIGATVKASLAEFDYFQIVSVDGKDVKMAAPDALIADFQGEQLIILFESKPAEPLKFAGRLAFGIYDPTFYTAIDYIEDEQMAVERLPAGCERRVVRPDPDEAIAENQATLTEDFFNQPGGNDLSKIFATRLEISCKTNG